MADKLLIDAIADAAEHTLEIYKKRIEESKHTEARDLLSHVSELTAHVQQIEDHFTVMQDRHKIDVRIDGKKIGEAVSDASRRA